MSAGHRKFSALFGAALVAMLPSVAVAAVDGVRIKDIARIQTGRGHALVGYGIVSGLAGTGDTATNRTTRQSISNLLAQFNLTVAPDAITSRNVAIVLVSAELPNIARPGDAIDVTVTSLGDAKSLVGGNLLVTPLKAPNNRTYVLAQGALTVGGYRYEANGTVGQKNHPTVATVPGGGQVEVAPPAPLVSEPASFSILLREADYTNAARVADAINHELGANTATARDPEGVAVTVPAGYQGRFVDLMKVIESLEIAPDSRARVVVNERTGTVVSGANVRIAPVAVSYGDLRISIATDNNVSQPTLLRQAPDGVRTAEYANSRIDLQESGGATLVTQAGGTIADLLKALHRMHTSARDVVSVLKALKAAGALSAELVVQ